MAKKVLLTWYGITDFRASLGLESNGPVLSALLNEHYDEVMVLGYSATTKQHQVGSFDDALLLNELTILDRSNPLDAQVLVEKFCNTRQAHKHFCMWLSAELIRQQRATKLTFRSIHLQQLNDTEGIYEAAIKAIEAIGSGGEAVELSLFLSPGTPVMAFVWAFAALNFPRIKKRLISSSQPGHPPETIFLPAEWMEWNGRQKNKAIFNKVDFDVCFHLFGEQRLPAYWGVTQYASKYHIFVASGEYDPRHLLPFLNGTTPCVLRVDPFDPRDVYNKILHALQRNKVPPIARIGFNLTGGTKMMYAGAMAACRKINGTPFYFNQQSNSVINLHTFERTAIKPILDVDIFLKLNASGMRISKTGRWDDIPDISVAGRQELTNFLWTKRSSVAKIYKPILDQIDVKNVTGHVAKQKARMGYGCFSYKDSKSKSTIRAASEWDDSASFTFGEKVFHFDHFPLFAKYLTGGWFEEYVYAQLLKMQEEGLITDPRINLSIALGDDSPDHDRAQSGHRKASPNGGQLFQEFDVLFTDRSRLYIVECKAGKVTAEHIIKLNDEVQRYGGIGGRGILACCFPVTNAVIHARLKEYKSCRLVCGENIAYQIRTIITQDRMAYV